ncbi:putative UBX domain, UBA-like superfamily, Ubiquitin-like domain superfamily [Helianthus annuus]|nr:putative UBX domain, UBA-like superfamily, Ubiquitin-like domain superfamily [Helianthus annuus]KAJ0665906.1 putative UBX domain, UBA-like superfamily, Ubiquitin-like domain superfamily [Helianthus annuus]
MADQESIDTFVGITGSSQLVAIRKLAEHDGSLNEAVNSYFTEGDTDIHETNVPALHEDFMDIDRTHRGFHDSNRPETASRNDLVTNSLPEIVPETRGTDDDAGDGISHDTCVIPSAPVISNLSEYGIEEKMIRAAIEASKREADSAQPDVPTEQDKSFGELESEAGPSETQATKSAEVEQVRTLASSNGRLGVGSSSVQDAEEQPLVRRSSRRRNLSSALGPAQRQSVNNPDEWGGVSSVEHNEAVMLEGAGFRVPYVRNRYRRNGVGRNNGPYTRSTPRSPSPTLTAQRLIREQQNEEYLASLQADREKELLEQAAREAAMEEEQRKLEQEQEIERQVAAKETSLPQEPASADDNAVALLVRMPDGSRHGRRFMKTDKLQYLFDFIDVGRVVKPSTYRLVRPYPRRAFSDGESDLTLNELGLTSKHEALFLELI